MTDAATAAAGEAAAPRSSRAPASQTLSRGIRVLEELSDARTPLAIDDIARRLGVHRSIAYRLLRTLEDHGLVVRDSAGLFTLGARMAALAAGVAQDLQAEALPELTVVANELGMTSLLAVADHGECITLVSIEPRHAVATVAQRAGARHPLTVGAPSKVLLSMLPEGEWPADVTDELRAEVAEAALRGYAVSSDEVIPTVQAVAVPLVLRGRRPASLAVVHVAGQDDPAVIAEHLHRSAAAIREALGG